MSRIFLALILTFSVSAFAASTEIPSNTLPEEPSQTVDTTSPLPTEPVVPPTTVPAPGRFNTQTLRGLSQYSGSIHFSPAATWIPLKYGLSGGYIYSEKYTIEGEFTQGSLSTGIKAIDLASVTDRRFGVQARWYPNTNSFNLILGLFRSEFSAELGNSIVSHISGAPQARVWHFESYGPEIGLSNRWQWQSGITFGVDWFAMYIPLFGKHDDSVLSEINNSSDRSDLDKLSGWVRNIPQFDLFKLTLGYNF